MKLILRQYIEDLRERDELDAILPMLLSELGYHVLSRPGRGARQDGVDVAAVGPDPQDNNKTKLFLFLIKSGDLTRKAWSGSPQSVHASLDEIIECYIPSRISQEHINLKIVICVCIGGVTRETVVRNWTGYQQKNSTEQISFQEWNSDKLANLLLTGLLKHELLPQNLRMAFQKSIAMLDEPDIAYNYMAGLMNGLRNNQGDDTTTLTRLRQLYVCLWVLFVWAREAGNLDAPYRASELALLHAWDICHPQMEKNNSNSRKCNEVIDQLFKLYMIIAAELLDGKIGQYSNKKYALSMAVNTNSSVDVNLALYEFLGRVSLFGLWKHWMARNIQEVKERREILKLRDQSLNNAIGMINANPGICSPIRDDFAIEIALFMMLANACDRLVDVSGFLIDMAYRLKLSISTRGGYPLANVAYHDLIDRPIDRSEEFFKNNTKGSILYPLLVSWLDALGQEKARGAISDTIKEHMEHCTQQVWMPDKNTDRYFWSGGQDHGIAIAGLDLTTNRQAYGDVLEKACEDYPQIKDISAIKTGFWPMLLLACRHHRMPIPPQLWYWVERHSPKDQSPKTGS